MFDIKSEVKFVIVPLLLTRAELDVIFLKIASSIVIVEVLLIAEV